MPQTRSRQLAFSIIGNEASGNVNASFNESKYGTAQRSMTGTSGHGETLRFDLITPTIGQCLRFGHRAVVLWMEQGRM